MALSKATMTALKIGAIGFIAGAAIGALAGCFAVGFGTGAFTAMFVGEAPVAAGAAGSSLGAAAATGASALGTSGIIAIMGICTALGAGIAGAAGAFGGWCYGAATDENASPETMERNASRITQKAPHLAQAVAERINNTAVGNSAQKANMSDQVVAASPSLTSPQQSTQVTTFQEKLATQAREPEMAASAQR